MSGKGRLKLTLLLCFAGVGSAAAAQMALENTLVSKAGNSASITVRLRCPQRYLDHTPSGAAMRARVNLSAVDDCPSRLGAIREASRPNGRQLADLDEIEYVNRGGVDGFLELHFSRPVSIQVSQRGDLRSLTIQVRPSAERLADDAGADAGLPEIQPLAGQSSLPRTPERLRRADEQARQAMQSSPTPAARGLYAINLASSTTPLNALDPAVGASIPDWQFYTTQTQVDAKNWYRLRLGFFATEAEAETALVSLQGSYPRAWVTRVPATEHQLADTSPLLSAPAASLAPASDLSASSQAAAPTLDAQAIEALMVQGRQAIMTEDYARAVQLYTRVLLEPENAQSATALEFLALARERNGQRAHAVAEYRRYLALYPASEGAARVRQRLAGLTAVAPSAAGGSRRPARRAQAEDRWNVYGGLAQYYRRDENQFDDQDRITSQSAVLSDFDLIANRQGDRVQFSSRATMGNFYDLLSDDEGTGTSSRVYYLYADLLDDVTGVGARVGRQSLRSAGVLGRFDGAHLSWQWRPGTRFNFMSGYPVDSADDSLNSDKMFYGVSVDFLELKDLFDVSLFYNKQEIDSIDDREAIGGELRYYDETRSLITNVDYDTSYSELNNLTVMGTWAWNDRLTFNALLDHRKSPFLSTRNALIGQPVSGMDELMQLNTEDEIRQLALDRTGEVTAMTVGLSMPVYDRFQLNADLTRSDYGGTPGSSGVLEIPDLDAEYYYSLNFIGSSLIKEGDSSIAGLRYYDGENSSTTSLFLETRYPVTQGFRINPRLRLNYREFAQDSSSEWSAMPGIRMFYRFARRYTFELETGSEFSSRDLDSGSSDSKSYYIYAGYRADFQ